MSKEEDLNAAAALVMQIGRGHVLLSKRYNIAAEVVRIIEKRLAAPETAAPCTCEGFDFSSTCPQHWDLAPS